MDQIRSEAPTILVVQSAIILALCGALWRTGSRLRRIEGARGTLLRNVSGENLEEMMDRHLREQVRLEGRLEGVEGRLGVVEHEMGRSKRHLGVVRYDAFDDVGGHQSFALAVLDDKGDGAVVNGVVGRSDVRVFCKNLVRGESERGLAPEEAEAIRRARDQDRVAVRR
ncbi:MAG: DUF4446 family protein [Fimbriimonadaceae bacterium]|nr:DUF4446 family protein [Fimbriimonadaceae bacterium]